MAPLSAGSDAPNEAVPAGGSVPPNDAVPCDDSVALSLCEAVPEKVAPQAALAVVILNSTESFPWIC